MSGWMDGRALGLALLTGGEKTSEQMGVGMCLVESVDGKGGAG